MCNTNQTACFIIVSPVMCTGLSNVCTVNDVETSLNTRKNLHLSVKDSYKVRVEDNGSLIDYLMRKRECKVSKGL